MQCPVREQNTNQSRQQSRGCSPVLSVGESTESNASVSSCDRKTQKQHEQIPNHAFRVGLGPKNGPGLLW